MPGRQMGAGGVEQRRGHLESSLWDCRGSFAPGAVGVAAPCHEKPISEPGSSLGAQGSLQNAWLKSRAALPSPLLPAKGDIVPFQLWIASRVPSPRRCRPWGAGRHLPPAVTAGAAPTIFDPPVKTGCYQLNLSKKKKKKKQSKQPAEQI